MAIDTENKRRGALNVGNPWRAILPVADATISQGDRRMLVFMYPGILLASGLVLMCLEVATPAITYTAEKPTITFVTGKPTISFVFEDADDACSD